MRSFQLGINIFSITLFVCIFTATGFAAEPNLVAHWQLDGDATDSSGYGHDGTVYGNPNWVAEGADGGAIEFDGFDDYVSAPAHSDLQPDFPFTVCSWVKANDPASGSFMINASPPDDGTYYSGFAILLMGDGSGRVKATYKNGGPPNSSSRHGKYSSTVLQADTWYHIAAVVRGYMDIDLYVNGTSEGGYDTGTATTIAYSSNDFFIASSNESSLFFDGAVDDVRVYDRALSEAEVDEIVGPALSVSDNAVYFAALESGPNPTDQILTVQNGGGGTVNWSMDTTSKPSWLTMTPTSGVLGRNQIEPVTLSLDTSGLTDGHYSYVFDVFGPAAANSPQNISIELFVVDGTLGDIFVPVHYPTIQEAINAAVYGDKIIVICGTYFENIKLKNGVSVIAYDKRKTIIDGNQNGSVVVSNNCDPNTILNGFTIMDGLADLGGGMYNYSSSPTLIDCTFTMNLAVEKGAGMANMNGSSPKIKNCVFSGNYIKKIGASGGGIVNMERSNPEIIDTIFEDNSVTAYGGGIYNYKSSPIINNCIFKNNSSGLGGGIRNYYESCPLITNCLFSNNSAASGGGGLENNTRCDPIIFNCAFLDNFASHGGGGIGNQTGSKPIVINSIFSKNKTSLRGGAIYSNFNSSPILLNCTISNNEAGLDGGGIYNWTESSPIITNCILWKNTASSLGNEIFNDGDLCIPTISYSDVLDSNGSGVNWDNTLGIDGGGNIDKEPSFIAPNNGNHRLSSDSPCIDTGDPDSEFPPDATDLDGNPRVINGIVDMGAYEFNPNTVPIADAGEDIMAYAWNDGIAEVKLNGSGSYDVNGDALEYFWFNDANELIATGAEPNALFGVGEHEITLIVNDGIEDSEPNSCVVTVEPAVEVSVKCTPKSLNCESNGRWIKAHFTMPAEYTSDDINTSIPCTLEPFGLASSNIKSSYNEQGKVILTVSFDRRDFCDMNPPGGLLQLTAVGRLNSGHYFYASDDIRILDAKMERLLGFATHWLEEGCGKPDWCDGQDVNRDTVVNLNDFVLSQ